MALAECNTTVDSRGRELLQHGTVPFPIACYHDDFRKMDVPWHWHEELEAAVITDGSCILAAGSEKVVLHAGDGFFINSGILHGAWDNDTSGCRFHSMAFHPRLVGGSLDSVFYQSYLQPLLTHPALEFIPLSQSVPWQKSALEAIESAWQACTQEPEFYEFRVRNALSELVCLIWGNLTTSAQHFSEKSLRDAERIKVMLSFIHDNYREGLTTGSIAASAMISESEALRCFHATIGTSPIRYLKQFRIQQAASMLESMHKISDVAACCGFQDMSYFTKSFRELKGCTPTQYIQKHKNANR
ncbi:MAG: AraC family transcriptional regulator [Oscillospiraceae bacterium]|nr:AraC family transcriptional regulator [Oscillospiraceae bacterium]